VGRQSRLHGDKGTEPGSTVPLIDWISDTLSQGYTNLQSLVKCLDHRNIVSGSRLHCYSNNDAQVSEHKLTTYLTALQFPLVSAWCITIHEVPGLSLDKAVIDIGKNAFAHGQAYVALSRVCNLEGVMLTGLQRSKLKLTDNAVHEEYARSALRPISS